ncbi:MAG: protease complex subunit PrcB family protein [bacterium]|nr:protease complex subunit PrcB family protein [bacterium]
MMIRRYMAAFLVVGIAAVLMIGGMASADKESMRTVSKGNYCAIEKREQQVINNEADWSTLWERMNAGILPMPERPAINFEKETLIAVFTGVRNSGGYSIEVTGVENKEALTTIGIKEKTPAADMMVSMSLTSPYHIVALPKLNGKIEFKKS